MFWGHSHDSGLEILAMTSTTRSLADVKSHLSEIVASAQATHGRTTITKNGRPAAVVLSVDDLESLEETLEVMRDPDTPAQRGRVDEPAGRADGPGRVRRRARRSVRPCSPSAGTTSWPASCAAARRSSCETSRVGLPPLSSSMTYRVQLSSSAHRTLARLPVGSPWSSSSSPRARSPRNPHRVGKALRSEYDGIHSVRRGDYRVRYEIHEDEVVVRVVKVGHRSGVHRSR